MRTPELFPEIRLPALAPSSPMKFPADPLIDTPVRLGRADVPAGCMPRKLDSMRLAPAPLIAITATSGEAVDRQVPHDRAAAGDRRPPRARPDCPRSQSTAWPMHCIAPSDEDGLGDRRQRSQGADRVRAEAPGMVKSMSSVPVVVLASMIACRSEPGPASAVVVTLKVASSCRASIASTPTRHPARRTRRSSRSLPRSTAHDLSPPPLGRFVLVPTTFPSIPGRPLGSLCESGFWPIQVDLGDQSTRALIVVKVHPCWYDNNFEQGRPSPILNSGRDSLVRNVAIRAGGRTIPYGLYVIHIGEAQARLPSRLLDADVVVARLPGFGRRRRCRSASPRLRSARSSRRTCCRGRRGPWRSARCRGRRSRASGRFGGRELVAHQVLARADVEQDVVGGGVAVPLLEGVDDRPAARRPRPARRRS